MGGGGVLLAALPHSEGALLLLPRPALLLGSSASSVLARHQPPHIFLQLAAQVLAKTAKLVCHRVCPLLVFVLVLLQLVLPFCGGPRRPAAGRTRGGRGAVLRQGASPVGGRAGGCVSVAVGAAADRLFV